MSAAPGIAHRRGVALLAALWLVVAIATVALQFSLEARDRRQLGIDAAERGQARAAALGALSLTQARLEMALRTMVSSSNARIGGLRASDPWLDVDSLYSGTVDVDSMPVAVQARDLGEQLNINTLSETELQSFFNFLLSDYTTATRLSQAIMDWRDADSIPRTEGAERDDYLNAGMLALPTNGDFREIEDLRNVMGVTPDIYAAAAPYLTTYGSAPVNLNTAPVPVLRALPGMTDATINLILQDRSGGRRIQSVSEIFPGVGGRGRRVPGQLASQALVNQISSMASVTTAWVELIITARVAPQAPLAKLVAIVRQNGNRTAYVDSMLWF